jgi:hypothetical protein
MTRERRSAATATAGRIVRNEGGPMTNVTRRQILEAAVAAVLASIAGIARAAPTPIEVWKTPDCGCCAEWVKHLEAHGFSVKVNNTGNAEIRARLGVPAKLSSCHTGLVAGYAIEGHVPANDIKRLLSEKPVAVGLAVPGMPVGSPGMEMDGRRDPYDVLLVEHGGAARTFSSHR